MINKKHFIATAFVAFSIVALNVGCGPLFEPCPNQVDCGGGYCAPSGSICCSETTYCNAGETCGPDNTCLGGGSGGGDVAACEGCLASGQQCCLNDDTTVDCTEVGRVCCGNHTSCASGTVCSGSECVY